MQYFGSQASTFPCSSIEQLFLAVQQEDIQFALVPLENSKSMNKAYDLLNDYDLRIIGETNFQVRHTLMTLPG